MKEFWSNITCQEKVKLNLQKIYSSGKIPHAFLFFGADGIGKYNLAIRFAQILNCSDINNFLNSPVNKKIAGLSEPYIKYIIPLPRGKNETAESSSIEKLDSDTLDALKEELKNKIQNPYHKIQIPNANNIKISSIREIKKFLSLSYDEIKYRVIIISDAHLMNDESQNALLKSLEEPPDGVIFILLTSYKNLLLETILSRCRVINFEPLKNDEIANILIQYFSIDKVQAEAVAPFAEGSATKAMELINYDFEELLEKTINILRYSLAMKYSSALKEINQIVKNNRGSLSLIISMINIWLNDTQRNKIKYDEYFYRNHIETLDKFNLRFSGANISKVINSLNILASSIENNVNLNVLSLNIIFELASLRYLR